MLKDVRCPGPDPELMASGAVAVQPPAALELQLPGPLRGSRIWAPRLDPPPRAGPEPVCPLSCAPYPAPQVRGGSGAGRRPGSGISTGWGGAERNRRNHPPGRAAGLLCAARRGPVHTRAGPSWAAPRFCVPQTPRLAAALAHKVVGNKIAFPGPSLLGICEISRRKSELIVAGSPASPSKNLCLRTWPPSSRPTPCGTLLKRSCGWKLLARRWGLGGLERLGRTEARQGDCNRGFWGCQWEASAGEWILQALWPNPRPCCHGSEAPRKSKHTENRPETWISGKRTQQTRAATASCSEASKDWLH